MSLLTMTRSGQPARIRKVACRLRSRAVTCWPTCWAEVEIPWTMWVRLINRPGEYRLNLFKSDQPKTYRDVDLAIATVRDDFGYYGSITLATEQRPKVGKAQAGPIADSDEE